MYVNIPVELDFDAQMNCFPDISTAAAAIRSFDFSFLFSLTF